MDEDAPRAMWRKSSHSGQEGSTCVEAAELGSCVGVRDSTDPHGPVLHLTRDAIGRFLTCIKSEPNSPAWRKSSYTNQEGGTCVELAGLDTGIGVRDSTDPSGPVLHFGRDAVANLVNRVKRGELDQRRSRGSCPSPRTASPAELVDGLRAWWWRRAWSCPGSVRSDVAW